MFNAEIVKIHGFIKMQAIKDTRDAYVVSTVKIRQEIHFRVNISAMMIAKQ